MSDEKDKMAFVLEQAQTENQGIIDAFDQIVAKGSSLLSLCVPLIAGLVGFAMLTYSGVSATSQHQWFLILIALAYADLLGFCCVRLWGVTMEAELTISGLNPKSVLEEHPELLDREIAHLYRMAATAHIKYIRDNRAEKDRRAGLLKAALDWFIWSPLACLAIFLASATLVWFFSTPRVFLFPFWLWLGQIV